MNVLIYVDDLPTSDDTLALAVQWLARMPARVTLTTVATQGRALLEAAAARLPLERRAVTLKPGHGDPAKVLDAASEAEAYDLLIAAPAGRGRLAHLVWGSRIGKIAQCVNTSLLIARRVPPTIRHILVGVGAADHSLVDVRRAVRVAGAFDAQVTMLHVVSQVPLMFTELEQMRLQLDAFLDSGLNGASTLETARQIVADAGLTPDIRLREGLVRDGIVDEASEGDYDLVVIGAHGDEGWMTLLLDDIADRVVRRCPISTLVVCGVPQWI
jgi:nucleotide-binding universal stress UspA family protein